MRRSEWIAAGYFLYLLIPIWLDASRRNRAAMSAWALGLAGAVAAVSFLPGTAVWRVVRDWAPGLYLLAGYWLPGRLFTAPNQRLEQWLLALDESCLGPRAVAGTARLPSMVGHYLELTYLLCYPLVPLAFGLLYFSRAMPASTIADSFWGPVLLAVFICYGLLPWLPTRPPRALLAAAATAQCSRLRRVNVVVLNHVSIQVNTFPSGHVAAALAAALAVGQVLPAAGIVIGLLSLSIAVAAVLGRYHYAADAVLGALAAVVAFAISRAA